MTKEAIDQAILARVRGQHIDFEIYNNAVTLIASIESLFRYEFQGKDGSAKLVEFDRFPKWFGKTPEFIARFDNTYYICGEHKSTFRDKNAKQVADYAQCGLEAKDHYDVLVLTLTTAHPAAARAIKKHFDDLPKEKQSHCPIVILGVHLDREHGQEFYSAMWNDVPGNQRFSKNNVAPDGHPQNLNTTVVGPDYFSIRIDRQSIARAGRGPIINDEPPLLYIMVRLLIPALMNSITQEEREACGVQRKKVEKKFFPDDVNFCEDSASNRRVLQHVHKAFRYLCKAKFCREYITKSKVAYIIPLHRIFHSKDHSEMFASLIAKYEVGKELGKHGMNAGTYQQTLFNNE